MNQRNLQLRHLRRIHTQTRSTLVLLRPLTYILHHVPSVSKTQPHRDISVHQVTSVNLQHHPCATYCLHLSTCFTKHLFLIMPPPRQLDIVLLGATGYTGGLVAGHIAKTFPTNLRWAIAGRSLESLQKTSASLTELNPDRLAPGLSLTQPLADLKADRARNRDSET